MTEQDACEVLLMRAVETSASAADRLPWTAADADWASREARHRLGERVDGEAFVLQRARLALARLRERDGLPLDAASPLPHARGLAALLLVLALLAGVASDAIGSAQRINLLAPPLLGLLAWNLLVYAALLLAALRRPEAAAAGRPRAGQDWLAASLQRLAQRLAPRSAAAWAVSARSRFVADWAAATGELQQQRIVALLHAAAASLVLGAVLSMYGRGLVFDFRAGWDSTFLGAAQVHAVLAVLLGPAAWLSGLGLPDAQALERLRWAGGGVGEGAARWIHLYAMTLGAVVVVPRLLLAGRAVVRSHRAAARVRLPLDEPYFRRLLRDAPAAAPHAVTVLPYSYTLGAAQRAGLAAALGRVLGPGAAPQLAATLPLGAEDDLPAGLPPQPADTVVALFALTATPERETHGAFLRALRTALPGRSALQVVVDESGFRSRLGVATDADTRLQQRRAAWSRLLHELSLPPPRFADLTATETD